VAARRSQPDLGPVLRFFGLWNFVIRRVIDRQVLVDRPDKAGRPRFMDVPGLGAGGCRTGPDTQEKIDAAIRTIVMGAFQRSAAILAANRILLDRCAHELLVHETLDEENLKQLTGDLVRA
jgi:ATP-dependent Zn protease